MEITLTEMKRLDLLEVSGRIDSSNAGDFEGAISNQMEAGTINFVIDLAEVTYMSSAGMRVLLERMKQIDKSGGKLVLAAPSARVREVIDLAGLETVFAIYDEQVEAVGSF